MILIFDTRVKDSPLMPPKESGGSGSHRRTLCGRGGWSVGELERKSSKEMNDSAAVATKRMLSHMRWVAGMKRDRPSDAKTSTLGKHRQGGRGSYRPGPAR
jgi:hypothetical protein